MNRSSDLDRRSEWYLCESRESKKDVIFLLAFFGSLWGFFRFRVAFLGSYSCVFCYFYLFGVISVFLFFVCFLLPSCLEGDEASGKCTEV